MSPLPPTDRAGERHRRLTQRGAPIAGAALVALVAGLFAGGLGGSPAEQTGRDFADAWRRGDVEAMRALFTPGSRRRYSVEDVRRALARAADTATARRVSFGEPDEGRDGTVLLPARARTSVFGEVRGDIAVPVSDELVEWSPSLAFPGLRRGERLTRRTEAPTRAALLSRDGKVLARGPADARSSPAGAGGSIAGTLGLADTREGRRSVRDRGLPASALVGKTGLERAFEPELAGRPGGELLAGRRLLARSRPKAGQPVRTTIDSRLQLAAVTALGERFGGVAALDARNGEVRALAGVAFSAPQPPGSTFKIVTTTAALEARLTRTGKRYPVQTGATIDGVSLENANGESCGGTFRQSFAHSCNSVFAPLGVRVGAERLVRTAERYGWNGKPVVDGELVSTLPAAARIKSPLELGSTAIGQGKVLATPFRMASVAQTIAQEGVMTEPSLTAGAPSPRRRVTSAKVARAIRTYMVDVVRYGTGTAAALPGIGVAGKTGTAELGDTRGPDAMGSDPSNTDAWFTAFAPSRKPRLAVGVLLVKAGAGGESAAPVAKAVLQAGLRR
ncbi:MAG: penicillin-binding transpeptidase domain-containing protein [Actinomycetota bacterium]|nr:penicillin-binding transpeptidase domain-containing protein [Actinomycetota bacterium]